MSLLVLVIVALAPPTRADEPVDQRRTVLTGSWRGARTWLAQRGVELSASYSGEGFAATEVDTCCVVLGVATLGIDVALDAAVDRRLGALHVQGVAIHGEGLTTELMDIHGVSNNVAAPEVRLYEAWVEQPLGPGVIRAGLIAADQELVTAEHATVLLDATFGMIGQVSANLVGPVYPIGTPGISGRLELGSVIARAAVYDGEQINRHGIPTAWADSALAFAELDLAGTVKLGAWTHSARADGAYLVLDHTLTDRLGGFARAGVSPGGLVELYADAGVRLGVRDDDHAGFGAAYSRIDDGNGVRHEAVIEATYRLAATGWLSIQPDAQVVVQAERTALVGGVRVKVTF